MATSSKKVSDHFAEQLRKSARNAASTSSSGTRKEVKKAVKDSVDKSLVKCGEKQKPFSEVFGFAPKNLPDFPVDIFEPEDWDESVRLFIPKKTGTHKWPEPELADLALGVLLGDNVWVAGPTGSGKSSLLKEFCAFTGRPFIRFNGRDDLEAYAFFGSLVAEEGSTHWKDGDYTTAFRHGAFVLVDEATVIPAGIMMGLQWTLEIDGKLLLADKPGTPEDRMVNRDPRFRLAFADNTKGLGDLSGNHAGTNTMNTATIDRFATSIHLDYLPSAHEVEMIRGKFPKVDKKIIEKVVQFASQVRTSHIQGELSLTLSPRSVMSIVQKLSYHGNIQRAVEVSYYQKLEEDSERDAVARLFNTVFDMQF